MLDLIYTDLETDNKLLEIYGDAVFIHLQDKPGQLLQVLEAFQVSGEVAMIVTYAWYMVISAAD